ncbi:MAG: hypothetical protein Q4G70_10150 [Pseudomonadota bacterium]|nr:hypothetical protein [Pseudomonadota bacterium]
MSAIHIRPADLADDAALRALLREVDMPGWVRMVTTREPSHFAASRRFGDEQTFIGHDGDVPVGMFACATQPLWINGQARTAGYLGALRVRPSYRHRARLLRQGFAVVRQSVPPHALPLWYTAIGSGNHAARRVLEAGLRGLPRYRYLNDLVTLALPARRGRRHGLWQPVPPAALPALCDFHARQASQYQFSPVLHARKALETGANFHAVQHAGQTVACVALWDQRGLQQARALGYATPLARALPLLNAWAHMARRVPLPRVGEPLDHGYAAFLAVAPDCPAPIDVLIEDALAICPTPILSLGLHGAHPWLALLQRRFHPARYATRLYAVGFDDDHALGPRPCQPEVAVM